MPDTYTIHLEGKWSLEDLYILPRTFEQVYFMAYSLLADRTDFELERIEHAYRAFPWQGGYSAVNFYNELKYATPKPDRPQIVSIHYGSPGWIELALIVSVALAIERIVKSMAGAVDHTHSVYNRIMRGLSERKLLRLKVKRKELQLKREELEYIEFCASEMGKLLGFTNIDEINERTGHPYVSLKILLSLYRRIRTLVKYEEKGKASFRNRK